MTRDTKGPAEGQAGVGTLRFALIAALAVLGVALEGQQPAETPRLPPTVILVSFDGFRWDYQTKAPTPNLDALAARGVRAENLIPSFPSKTFPNHYAIVTGLYPGHSGIVANSVYDPDTGRAFAMSNRAEVRDPMWWGGDPIWSVAERAGEKTAPFFWPGSEASHGGAMPTYWEPYDVSMPADARVDRVLGWLDLRAAERPRFMTLYFEDADTAGHDFGPDSPEVRDAIASDDHHLGRLIDGLTRRGLLDQVDIVVVSDHGMTAVSPSRVVVVDDYVSLGDVTISDINPTLGLFPKPGKNQVVYDALVHASPHLAVYRRGETPARWHYEGSSRVPPIIGVAEEGWQVLRRATLESIEAGRTRASAGAHGYGPELMSMRAIFVAAGPSFQQGVAVPAFENVGVYDVLAAILGVRPSPNDGDPAVAHKLLRN